MERGALGAALLFTAFRVGAGVDGVAERSVGCRESRVPVRLAVSFNHGVAVGSGERFGTSPGGRGCCAVAFWPPRMISERGLLAVSLRSGTRRSGGWDTVEFLSAASERDGADDTGENGLRGVVFTCSCWRAGALSAVRVLSLRVGRLRIGAFGGSRLVPDSSEDETLVAPARTPPRPLGISCRVTASVRPSAPRASCRVPRIVVADWPRTVCSRTLTRGISERVTDVMRSVPMP